MTEGQTVDIANDGERMVPELHRPSLMYAEHLTRYLAAQEIVRGKRVLDIASGSGYGTQQLAETAASVIGVDVSADAVAYAARTHPHPHVEYRQGNAEHIPVEDASVDVVVTFETIEHVEDYERFMAEIDRVLAPGGVAIISTPNDLEFIEGNHFHLHEFVYDELMDLVTKRFPHVRPYFQGTWKAVAVAPAEALTTEGPVDLPVLNLAPLAAEQFLYFYLVCSREPLDDSATRVPSTLALGAHWSDRGQQESDLAYAGSMEAAIESLRAELASAREETAAARRDVETIRATRSYRLASRLSNAAGRLGRRA